MTSTVRCLYSHFRVTADKDHGRCQLKVLIGVCWVYTCTCCTYEALLNILIIANVKLFSSDRIMMAQSPTAVPGNFCLPPVRVVNRHHVEAALSGVDFEHEPDGDGGLTAWIDSAARQLGSRMDVSRKRGAAQLTGTRSARTRSSVCLGCLSNQILGHRQWCWVLSSRGLEHTSRIWSTSFSRCLSTASDGTSMLSLLANALSLTFVHCER